jgi:hypothetical protein
MASSPSTSNSINNISTGTYSTIATGPSWTITNGSLMDSSIHMSDETRDILLETFKEDELEKILITVKERNPDQFPNLLKDFVRNRHFSEDFLLSYAEYLTKEDIKRRHNEHLISGDYPTLALLLISR